MLSSISTREISEQPIPGFIKMLVMATYATMFVAAGTGTAMVLVRPPDGDSIDSVLGAIAGVPGIATAIFGSLSLALLFHRRQTK